MNGSKYSNGAIRVTRKGHGDQNGHSNGLANGDASPKMNGHLNGSSDGHINGSSDGHVNGGMNGAYSEESVNGNGYSEGHLNGDVNGVVDDEDDDDDEGDAFEEMIDALNELQTVTKESKSKAAAVSKQEDAR
jgi:hypothetical protein